MSLGKFTFKGLKKGKRSRLGAISMEFLIVIGGMALLIMSGMYIGNMVMRDIKVNDALSNMQLIHTKVTEMYNNEGSYEGLTDKIFINSGNAPSSMISSDRSSMKSPWGKVELTSDSPYEDFTLKFDNVPGDVCQRLGSVMRNSVAWESIKVGNATYELADAGVGSKKGNSLVSFLSENCVNNSGTPVTLEFTSRKQ